METSVNQCGARSEDFSSVPLFDAHRVDTHGLNYPEHEDGRRCLDVWECTSAAGSRTSEAAWSTRSSSRSLART
jgi:hypothetical protein